MGKHSFTLRGHGARTLLLAQRYNLYVSYTFKEGSQ